MAMNIHFSDSICLEHWMLMPPKKVCENWGLVATPHLPPLPLLPWRYWLPLALLQIVLRGLGPLEVGDESNRLFLVKIKILKFKVIMYCCIQRCTRVIILTLHVNVKSTCATAPRTGACPALLVVL